MKLIRLLFFKRFAPKPGKPVDRHKVLVDYYFKITKK